MGDRPVLGPLTTAFAYPSSCSVVVKDCVTCSKGYQGQTCGTNTFNTQGIQDDPSCWPPRAADDVVTDVALLGWGIYSPGINCPDGYATACAATQGVDGGFPFQFSLEKSETAVGCCPTGYHCLYEPGINFAQTCFKVYSTGSFPTVQCSSRKSNSFSYLSVPATMTAETTASGVAESDIVLSRITVVAPMFQLNWQSSDRPAETTATKSRADTTIPTNPTTTGARQGNSDDGSDGVGGGGLSKGAAAGIGVGVGIVGLLLLGALVWFVRRRRSVPRGELSAQAVQPQEFQPQEWKHPGPYPGGYVAELSTQPMAELPGAPPRY